MAPEFPQIPGQRGLATTPQLLEHGWTYSTLSHLVATTGRRVLPRVYLPHRLPVEPDDIILAGWLWAGRDTVLTGARALARHGLSIDSFDPITRFLTGRDGRNREGNLGMEVRRTRRLPRGSVRGDLVVSPVERALVDAARYKEAPPRDLEGWTISALQKRLTTPDRLDAEVTASGWLGLAPVTAGCAAFRRGAWSVPEASLIDLVEQDARLPRMVANRRLWDRSGRLIGRPDGYFVDVGVAVQVHSRRFHDGPDAEGRDRWVTTVEGDTMFARHGIVVTGVTPTTLASDPSRFLDALVDVVNAHGGRPAPTVKVEGEQDLSQAV